MLYYKVKVTEKHTDTLWVRAGDDMEARHMAQGVANCQYDVLYDVQIMDATTEMPDDTAFDLVEG